MRTILITISITLLLCASTSAQQVTIMKETDSTIILNEYHVKSDNHEFTKIGSVDIVKPDYRIVEGVKYESKRFIVAYRKNEVAITFVEWESELGDKHITSYYIEH